MKPCPFVSPAVLVIILLVSQESRGGPLRERCWLGGLKSPVFGAEVRRQVEGRGQDKETVEARDLRHFVSVSLSLPIQRGAAWFQERVCLWWFFPLDGVACPWGLGEAFGDQGQEGVARLVRSLGRYRAARC